MNGKAGQPAVLLTGGAGYIGSHTAKALAAKGMTPVVFDNFSRGHREFVKWGPAFEGDLLDPQALKRALREHQPQAVIHFAALAYVGESSLEPERYYRNNVVGTLNLLEAMLEAQVECLVFSSTCATYGIPESIPIREDARQEPINPYGNTKFIVEKMLHDFGAAHGLRSVCLRYFNAAGADLDGDIGEWHDPETHLLPLALAAAAGDTGPLKVLGCDYPTPDGTCIRDFIHVRDLGEAHCLALHYLQKGGASARLNLGTGRGHSVLEVIQAVERVTGKSVPVEYAPRRPGDPPVLVAGNGLAGELLGWAPQCSDLETLVASAWAWYQKRAASRS
jgi:UDP-arabinose 4-epimerase